MTTRTVVTGIGIVSPVGLTRDSTWQNLLRGVSGIDRISSFDPEELETTIAGEVKGFEPTEYMTRKDARRMDRFFAIGRRRIEGGDRSGGIWTVRMSGCRSWWRAVSGGSSRYRSRSG